MAAKCARAATNARRDGRRDSFQLVAISEVQLAFTRNGLSGAEFIDEAASREIRCFPQQLIDVRR
jgi:hypothetical protein